MRKRTARLPVHAAPCRPRLQAWPFAPGAGVHSFEGAVQRAEQSRCRVRSYGVAESIARALIRWFQRLSLCITRTYLSVHEPALKAPDGPRSRVVEPQCTELRWRPPSVSDSDSRRSVDAATMTRCAEVTDAAKDELPRMRLCSRPRLSIRSEGRCIHRRYGGYKTCAATGCAWNGRGRPAVQASGLRRGRPGTRGAYVFAQARQTGVGGNAASCGDRALTYRGLRGTRCAGHAGADWGHGLAAARLARSPH